MVRSLSFQFFQDFAAPIASLRGTEREDGGPI